MLAENFAKHLPCWQNGGRKTCSKDPMFNKMETDIWNDPKSVDIFLFS